MYTEILLVVLLLSTSARSSSVCCDIVGCFADDVLLPNCPEVIYMLYTDVNQTDPVWLKISNDSSFPNVTRVVFLAHGWNANGKMPWIVDMKNQLLLRGEQAVVIIDWEKSSHWVVSQAFSNTWSVGVHAGKLMEKLLRHGISYIWCIGHSMGAHVCGHAGNKTSINRITGLDPSTLNVYLTTKNRTHFGLVKESATFVDVIHTTTNLGIQEPIGHADYYPNGYAYNPSCFFDIVGICRHLMAYKYFIESIKSDCYRSSKFCFNFTDIPISCSSCGYDKTCPLMGYSADPSASGIFYLKTTRDAPYCITNTDSF